jgi:hypothetical protein
MLFLWPLVVVAIVTTVRWRHLKNRISFVVLGYFVCLGAQAIVGTVGYTYTWVNYIGSVPRDRILVALVDSSLSVVVLAAILSIGPVLWLARVCTQIETREAP